MLPFHLYIPLDGKNLKDGSLFLETYCKPPLLSSRDREDPGALPGTLPERGIPVGGLLHHHGMEHFPRRRKKLLFDSILRANFELDASSLDIT
jgi:hypothetical protein